MTRVLGIAGGMVLAGFILCEVFGMGLTNDTDMLLHTASHMLYEGGLYRRWITINPPVIYFLYAIPVLGGVYSGLPFAMALHGFTAELCGLSVLACHYYLRLHRVNAQERRLWVAAAALALFIAPCAFQTFADREHYLFIFAMPWLLQMLLRLPPSRFSTVLAMIGFCIKPYNLLLLPALILTGGPVKWRLPQRLFSPSARLGAAMLVPYILFLFVIFPDYPLVILPIALKTYSAVTYPLATRAREATEFFALALVLIAGVRPNAMRAPFIGFSAAAALIYCLNGGWTYTRYVPLMPLCLLCTALRLSGGALRKTVAILLGMSIVGFSAYTLEQDISCTNDKGNACNYANNSARFKKMLHQAAGDEFILISVNLWSTAIAAVHGAPHSVYAYDDGPWPLAWIGGHPQDPATPRILQTLFVAPLVKALEEHPAATLIVDESPGQYSDFWRALKNDPAVQKALAGKSEGELIDTCLDAKSLECRFHIIKRQAP